MASWRQITGWRAVLVLIGGIVMLGVLPGMAMYVIELPITTAASYAEIASDSVEQSWLPPFLPRDATAIREVHDLDTDERWIAFQAPPSTLRSLVRDWTPLSWANARQSALDRPLRVRGDWPAELSPMFWHTPRDIRLLSYHRDQRSGWCLAVEWEMGRAWGWTCERVG